MAGRPAYVALIQASNHFAFKFLRESLRSDRRGNVMVSPLGLVGDLALLLNGTNAATQADICSVMRWQNLSLAEINQGSLELRNVVKAYSERREAEKWVMARSLWIVAPERFRASFRAAAADFHGVELQELETGGDPAVDAVNDWISHKTEGVLQRVLSSFEGIDFLLVDATYLEGSWFHPFDKASTRTDRFHTASGTPRSLPFMQMRREFMYLPGDGFEAVELSTLQARMYVILPNPGVPIDAFAERVTGEAWLSWQKDFVSTPGRLELPRFKTEYRAEVASVLMALGLERLFTDPDTLGPAVENPEGAKLKSALQAVSLEVDEDGMRVASAMSLLGYCMAALSKPRTPFHMVVNRPFLFVICDSLTQAILYLGVVKDPA